MRDQHDARIGGMADGAQREIVGKERRKPAPQRQWRTQRPPGPRYERLQPVLEEEPVRKQQRQHENRPRPTGSKRSLDDAFNKPFTADTGVEIKSVEPWSLAKIKTMVESGNVEWDASELDGLMDEAAYKAMIG